MPEVRGGFEIKKIIQILLATAVPVIIADVVTKAVIMSRMALGESIEIISGFFNIVYYRNTGAAFSILASGGALRTVVLGAASVVSLIVIGVLLKQARSRMTIFALSLILGGAIGNLADRLRFGWVVDFLEFYIGSYRWPAFNVADSAITIGVIIALISHYMYEGKADTEEKHTES